MKDLHSGAAVADITPHDAQFLFGYPFVHRYATGVNDRLYSSALYLTDGHTPVVFIANDIIFVTREMTVKYLRPIYVLQPLKIFGLLEEDQGRDILTRGEIRDGHGNLLTESRGILTRVNPEKMKLML